MTIARHEIHAPPAAAESFTVDSIEAQIKSAWSELAMRAEETGTQPPVRTSILTLVVVARGDGEIQRAGRTLHNLVRALPSRVILVSVRERVTDLVANVSAHCAFQTSEQAACYEVIEIETNPGSLRAVPSMLIQLEISDLPTFIWWAGPAHIASPEFQRISGAAERIMIDSARFNDPLESMRQYAGFLQRNSDTVAGTDLTWGRLLTLRELLAQSFDVPAAQQMLPAIQRVDMTFDPGYEADAILTAGWLSSRLGWEPVSASESREVLSFSAMKADGDIARFNLSEISGAGLGLRSVRLVSHTRQHSSRVSVRRTDRLRATVDVEMTAMPRQQRIVHWEDSSDDQVLGAELLQFTRDSIYEHALDHAARFASMLNREKDAQ